jgi:16S rRNA (uracil1498-N3)-methyltransferase
MSSGRPITAPVFLVDPGVIGETSVTFSGDEGRHAVTVRRISVGEPIVLTDGVGTWAAGEVSAVTGRDRVTVTVTSQGTEPAPFPRVVVVQALPKGDRGETAVETLTEVGVDVIVPWVSERTQVKADPERASKIVSRWRSTARESAKQARRMHVPVVTDIVRGDALTHLIDGAAVLVLDAEGEQPLAMAELPLDRDIVLVVGPEGGLSPDELAEFAALGATTVRLGPSVLRTSTAGTVAAGLVLASTPRWRNLTPESDRSMP